MRATDPLIVYTFVVGVVLPLTAVAYLEAREARRRRRDAAHRRAHVRQSNVLLLDGKRLERRVVAARAEVAR